jgi:hypothetical protein
MRTRTVKMLRQQVGKGEQNRAKLGRVNEKLQHRLRDESAHRESKSEELRQAQQEIKRVSDARDAEKNAKISAIHNSTLMMERLEHQLEEKSEELRQAQQEIKRVSDARDGEKNAKIEAIHNSTLMMERHKHQLEEKSEELRQAQLEIKRVSDDRDAEKNAKLSAEKEAFNAIRNSTLIVERHEHHLEEQKRASDVALAIFNTTHHRKLKSLRLCADIQREFFMRKGRTVDMQLQQMEEARVAKGSEQQENHCDCQDASDDSVELCINDSEDVSRDDLSSTFEHESEDSSVIDKSQQRARGDENGNEEDGSDDVEQEEEEKEEEDDAIEPTDDDIL